MPRPRIPLLAFVADLVAVVVFAAVGRVSHGEDGGLLGVLGTALPFALGTLIAWVHPRVRTMPVTVRSGAMVAGATVVVGLALRWGFTGRLPWSFAVVTIVVLAVLMLGWRGLSGLVARGARSGSREIPRG